MEASRVEGRSFVDFSRLRATDLIGFISAALLLFSLFIPWFSTSDANPNSAINGMRGDLAAWDVFPILRWLLAAACIAPFILAYIIVRGHALTWRPGEITMIVGMTALVLILCNGVILGKPGDPDAEISRSIGYFVGLLGSAGLVVGGFLRQAYHSDAKKPPGIL